MSILLGIVFIWLFHNYINAIFAIQKKKIKKKKSGDKVLYSLMLSEGSKLFYPFKK